MLPSVWYVILGAKILTRALFWRFDNEISPKSGVGMSDWLLLERVLAQWWCLVALWKPWTSSIGQCVRYSTVALPQPSKWSAKWTHFASSYRLLSPWRPPERYGASSRPMAAFSGFYESPGPFPSGNAYGITPLHRHGYRNGQRRRYICSLLPPHSFDQNIAKRPC